MSLKLILSYWLASSQKPSAGFPCNDLETVLEPTSKRLKNLYCGRMENLRHKFQVDFKIYCKSNRMWNMAFLSSHNCG